MQAIKQSKAVEKSNSVVQQYLSFSLAGAEYAVDVQFVQELRGREDTSSCPNAPEFVLGVINLRGMLVPIINLRSFFALPERDANLKTTVIIITFPDENIVLGLVVDAVSDVCGIGNHQRYSSSNQAGLMANGFISGLATLGQEKVALLDIHKLVHQGILSRKIENKCGLESKAACA